MNFKTYVLNDLVEVQRKNIKPQMYQDVTFEHYSLPSFDDGKKPEISLGKNIKSTKYIIPKEAILFSKLNLRFKRVWKVNNEENKKTKICSTEFFPVVIKDENIIDLDYLYYNLISDQFINELEKTAGGTSGSHQRISLDSFLNKEIQVPELKEQKVIAGILSTLDQKISVNNQICNKIEMLSRTIFKHWFIDFEFPNENGEPYKSSGGKFTESELGPIPSDWNIGKLKDISDIIMGQSPSSKTYNTEGKGLGLINGASDFSDGKIHPTKYTTDPKKISQKGDFVFGVRATVGNVTHIDKEYALGRGVAVARPLQPFLKEFLYFQLIKVIDYLEKTSTGSVYINITKSDLENFPIIIPSKRVLKNYHKLVNPFFNKVINNHLENEKLLLMRDNLLPKLMSGEIRVPIESE